MKESTLLVLGQEEQRPDYDYSAGATLRIYQPKEGQEMTAKIPDLLGDTVNTIHAVKKEGRIWISVKGSHTDWNVEIFDGNTRKETVLEAGQEEITVE